MLTYRIGKRRYARDLSGEGARLNGGRWNHKRTPCIYTAESRALALLEFTVNTNIDDIPGALTVTTFDLPENAISEIRISGLPRNWKQSPAPASTKDFGTKILNSASALIFKIPSVVVPEEFNYIINPLHQDIRKIKVISVSDFHYDVRIKKDAGHNPSRS